jgi:hypothetical protein
LENDLTGGRGLLSTRVDASSILPLYISLEKATNTRALVLEVDSRLIPRGLKLPSCTGFTTEMKLVAPSVAADVRITIRLAEPKATEVFTALAKDVATHVLAAPDARAAVATLAQRLLAWQSFFRKSGVAGLDRESQQGLFAELWFMRSKLIDMMSPAEIVDAWTGASKRNQDFQFLGATIEVKSSAANPPVRFRVANVKQLEQTSSAPLFLYVVLVDCREGAGESLAQAVAATSAMLADRDPLAAALFEERLIEVGYAPTPETPYESPKFTVQRDHLLRVVDSFPRLLPSDLRAGVGDVTYSVELSSCLGYSVDLVVLKESLTGGSDGAGA